MHRMLRAFMRALMITSLVVIAVSCTIDPHEEPPTASKTQKLSTEPYAAVQFPDGMGIHGIDATKHLWFAAVAYPPAIHVARRVTGQVLGTLPPPPTALPGGGTGFGAPVAVRVAPDGRILVLDGVVAPVAAGSAPAMLYEYQVQPTWSGFAATLVRSQVLPLIAPSEIPIAFMPEPRPPVTSGIFFPIMMTAFQDGSVALTDTVIGAAWVSDPTRSSFRNAIQDPRLRALPQLTPIVGKGRAPGGGTRDYSLQLTTGGLPGAFGIAHLAATDEVVMANPSQGMVAMPYATFIAATDPTAKSGTVRPLAAPTVGLTDLVAGLDTNRWDSSDPYVYFQRVAADASADFKNVMARVHGQTGAIEVLGRSTTVFDFDVAIAVVEPLLPPTLLPPYLRIATVGSAVGQEENNPFVNATPSGTFVAPTPIGAVLTTYH